MENNWVIGIKYMKYILILLLLFISSCSTTNYYGNPIYKVDTQVRHIDNLVNSIDRLEQTLEKME